MLSVKFWVLVFCFLGKQAQKLRTSLVFQKLVFQKIQLVNVCNQVLLFVVVFFFFQKVFAKYAQCVLGVQCGTLT